MKTLFLALAASLFAAAHAETVEIPCDLDTYTIPAGGCHGSSSELWLANKPAVGHPDERVMLHFDLSGYEGESLESAVLSLDVFFQCPSGQGTFCHFLAVTEDWDETWSGAHASCGSEIYQTFHFQGLGWHEIDITDLVSDWLDETIPNHGVVLKVIGVYPWTKIRSGETASVPTLTLEFNEQPLDASTWGGIKASLSWR